MKNRGFTLVELSIVLVIIGLLIGGILAAQSMIETARIQSFVRQLQQFDVAVSNFKSKYKGLPGDSTYFGGNGNGNLVGSGGYPTFFDGEVGNFWIDLHIDGFMPSITFATVGSLVPLDYSSSTARNIPKASIGSTAGVVATGTTGSTFGEGDGSGYNYYLISYFTSPFLSSHDTSGITQNQILAVDIKLDDGNVSTGAILNSDPVGNGCDMSVRMLAQQAP